MALEHVSDTALMVAACRALETARPDGLLRDPFAARLAGELGMAIARSMPALDWMCNVIGLRGRFIDEFLTGAARSVDTVANLGAGLDTRPWRLELDPALRWIEVDFAPILDYKASILAGEQPHCRLERMTADVIHADSRGELFQRLGSGPSLVLTEGLLLYLPAEAVTAFAGEAPAQSWILDVVDFRINRLAHGEAADDPVAHLRAEGHLAGTQILDVAARRGWRIAARRTFLTDGPKVAPERVPPGMEDDGSGVYLLSK